MKLSEFTANPHPTSDSLLWFDLPANAGSRKIRFDEFGTALKTLFAAEGNTLAHFGITNAVSLHDASIDITVGDLNYFSVAPSFLQVSNEDGNYVLYVSPESINMGINSANAPMFNVGTHGFEFRTSDNVSYLAANVADGFRFDPVWNDGEHVFRAMLVNVTDTDSDPASLLQDWQVDGGSQLSVNKAGDLITFNANFRTAADHFSFFASGASAASVQIGSNFIIGNSGTFDYFHADSNGTFFLNDGTVNYFQVTPTSLILIDDTGYNFFQASTTAFQVGGNGVAGISASTTSFTITHPNGNNLLFGDTGSIYFNDADGNTRFYADGGQTILQDNNGGSFLIRDTSATTTSIINPDSGEPVAVFGDDYNSTFYGTLVLQPGVDYSSSEIIAATFGQDPDGDFDSLPARLRFTVSTGWGFDTGVDDNWMNFVAGNMTAGNYFAGVPGSATQGGSENVVIAGTTLHFLAGLYISHDEP